MSWFSEFMKGGKNPADAAQGPLNEAKDVVNQNYAPYEQQGQNAYNQMSGPLGQMTNDPSGFINKLMESYKQSGDFQRRNQNALDAAGNTAASGGMRGSIQDIAGEAGITDSLLGADMQQWLQNVLGRQDAGIAGNQHIYDTGYNATMNKTNDLSNILGTQSTLNFQGQANRNKAQQDMFKMLLSSAAQMFGQNNTPGALPPVSEGVPV